MRAQVVTVSNRAAAGVYEDRGGPILVEGLRALGFEVEDAVVVPDGEPVAAAVRAAIDSAYDVIVTTGGTGVNPNDRTPEMTAPLLDREMVGVAEALRRYGEAQGVPAAVLSRGVAGVAGRTFVVNLPGSPGGCRDGLAVLGPILRHVVDQIAGGDHPGSMSDSDEAGA